MPILRSPDGSEEVEVNDPAEWQHYVSLGATPVQPPEPPGAAAGRAPGYTGPITQGPDESGNMAPPWYADPVELPAMLLAGPGGRIAGAAEKGTEAALAKGGAAIGSAASRLSGKGAGGMLGDVAGQTLLEMGLDVLPAPVRGLARVAVKKLAGGGAKEVAEEAGSAASRVARKAAPKAAKKAAAKAEEEVTEKAGSAASRAKPRGASKPELERRAKAMESMKARKVAGEIKPKGSAASRVKAETTSRHEVQYYSESQGKFVPIEDMHIGQLKNAINKLGRKLMESTHPSPVQRKTLEALKAEAIHRFQQAGDLTVGY